MPRYCKGLTTGDDSTSLQQFLSIVGWVKVEPLSLTRNFLAFMGFKLFQLHINIKYIQDQLFRSDDWFFVFNLHPLSLKTKLNIFLEAELLKGVECVFCANLKAAWKKRRLNWSLDSVVILNSDSGYKMATI